MHGLPINLQLVARRLEEEKVIGMCRTVLSALSEKGTNGTTETNGTSGTNGTV